MTRGLLYTLMPIKTVARNDDLPTRLSRIFIFLAVGQLSGVETRVSKREREIGERKYIGIQLGGEYTMEINDPSI